MKTAMQQLRDKLQTVVDQLHDAAPNTDQYGYRDAFKNAIADIDAQMLEIEKQQIGKAHDSGHVGSDGEGYYTETFTK